MSNSIVQRLQDIIELEELALKNYQLRSNFSTAYVELQSKRIATLNSITNELKELKYFDYWLETEFLIRKILEQDPLIGEIMMFISINPTSRKSASITNRLLY